MTTIQKSLFGIAIAGAIGAIAIPGITTADEDAEAGTEEAGTDGSSTCPTGKCALETHQKEQVSGCGCCSDCKCTDCGEKNMRRVENVKRCRRARGEELDHGYGNCPPPHRSYSSRGYGYGYGSGGHGYGSSSGCW